MRFTVLSMVDAEAYVGGPETYGMISITCADLGPANLQEDLCRIDLLRLEFDDADRDGYRSPTGRLMTPITSDQAAKIVAFHRKLVKYGVDHIVVHCLMGMCRSAGVAAALTKLGGGDDGIYFASGAYGSCRYRPNMKVYRSVLEAGGLRMGY